MLPFSLTPPQNDLNFLNDFILQIPREKKLDEDNDQVLLTSLRAQKIHSGRTNGLRGEMAMINRNSGIAVSSEQQKTGLCEELTQLSKPKQNIPTYSHSDSSLTRLPSLLPPLQEFGGKETEAMGDLILTSPMPLSSQQVWLKKAILGKERRPFLLIPSYSDTCLRHSDGSLPPTSDETGGDRKTHLMVSQIAEALQPEYVAYMIINMWCTSNRAHAHYIALYGIYDYQHVVHFK